MSANSARIPLWPELSKLRLVAENFLRSSQPEAPTIRTVPAFDEAGKPMSQVEAYLGEPAIPEPEVKAQELYEEEYLPNFLEQLAQVQKTHQDEESN